MLRLQAEETRRMGYRGPDLDLRTSRGWSGAGGDAAASRDAGPVQGARPLSHRGAPIWVDDTLLACANHAYDVALAYRSPEVRLEHLLQAMTRVDTAVAALEARGVRVVALRRDSALAIAGGMPASHGEPAATPRRAPEVEDVLRLAAARAGQAGRPAGIDDVVQVLAELGSDLPGADLVARHFPRLSRDFWGAVTPARPTSYSTSAHMLDSGDPLNAVPPPAIAPPRAAIDQGFVQRVLDRLTESERALSERLAAVEAAIARMPQMGDINLQAIANRLEIIEEAVLTRETDAGVSDRLSALEQGHRHERETRASALAALAGEVNGLGSAVALAAQRSDEAQIAFSERLQQIASGFDQHRVDLASGLGDRIAAIEQAISTQEQRAAETHGTYRDELSEVHDALMKINSNQHTLAGAIDQWRSNDSGELHIMNARIGAVQEDGGRRLQALEKLSADLEALSRHMAEQPSRPRGLRKWLFGTDDWIKASWSPPSPRPPPTPRSPPAWRSAGWWRLRPAWRLPFRRDKSGDV
jgi:hypothetical protein